MCYWLYLWLGLNGSIIICIFFLSIIINWLGYILLGGVIFMVDLVKLLLYWYISQIILCIIGGVMLIFMFCYLFGCVFVKCCYLMIKGQWLVLFFWCFVLLQMGFLVVNWMVMGVIIWLLLGSEINYFLVLGVLLVSSIVGVIIYILVGIGVLEVVFIVMFFGEDILKGVIIVVLFVWCVFYYFLLLLLVMVVYLLLESWVKKLW